MYDKHSGQMCGMCKRLNFTQQCDEFPRKILKENIRTSCFHDKYAKKKGKTLIRPGNYMKGNRSEEKES